MLSHTDIHTIHSLRADVDALTYKLVDALTSDVNYSDVKALRLKYTSIQEAFAQYTNTSLSLQNLLLVMPSTNRERNGLKCVRLEFMVEVNSELRNIAVQIDAAGEYHTAPVSPHKCSDGSVSLSSVSHNPESCLSLNGIENLLKSPCADVEPRIHLDIIAETPKGSLHVTGTSHNSLHESPNGSPDVACESSCFSEVGKSPCLSTHLVIASPFSAHVVGASTQGDSPSNGVSPRVSTRDAEDCAVEPRAQSTPSQEPLVEPRAHSTPS